MLIPLHKFLQTGGELAVPIDIPKTVAELKNYGGSIYINDEYVHDNATSTLLLTLNHDDPLLTLDYILQNLRADEMSIDEYPEQRLLRLWWD